MATGKKSGTTSKTTTGTLLSSAFKPGKDGVVYFYFWVKYMDKRPAPTKGKVTAALMKSQTNVVLVDVNGMHKDAFAPFCFDLKHVQKKAGKGHFGLHWLPPGTTRKVAEAWIKSDDGKAWAGDYDTAMSTFSIRVF